MKIELQVKRVNCSVQKCLKLSAVTSLPKYAPGERYMSPRIDIYRQRQEQETARSTVWFIYVFKYIDNCLHEYISMHITPFVEGKKDLW